MHMFYWTCWFLLNYNCKQFRLVPIYGYGVKKTIRRGIYRGIFRNQIGTFFILLWINIHRVELLCILSVILRTNE